MKTCLTVFTFLALAFCSCSNRMQEDAVQGEVSETSAALSDTTTSGPELSAEERSRKMIRQGDIAFETVDLKETRKKILATTRKLGGYVSEERQSRLDDRTENTMLLRIPAAQFDELVESITDEVAVLDARNISTQDVTRQFMDSEARLLSKKEAERRCLELLKQAKKVSEIAGIQAQAARLREEIDAMEGEVKYLTNQVLFSTLTVRFYEIEASSIGFTSRMGSAFASGWRGLGYLLIFFAHLWPLWVTLGLGFIGYKLQKSKSSL